MVAGRAGRPSLHRRTHRSVTALVPYHQALPAAGSLSNSMVNRAIRT
jgi:hypothetical protein